MQSLAPVIFPPTLVPTRLTIIVADFSWSIGALHDPYYLAHLGFMAYTLPNLLRGSCGRMPDGASWDGVDDAGFNVAVSGATVASLPAQADELVSRLAVRRIAVLNV